MAEQAGETAQRAAEAMEQALLKATQSVERELARIAERRPRHAKLEDLDRMARLAHRPAAPRCGPQFDEPGYGGDCARGPAGSAVPVTGFHEIRLPLAASMGAVGGRSG